MTQGVEAGRFTIGVFQDVTWAERGIGALKGAGFPPESLTIVALDSPGVAALMEQAFGAAGERLDLPGIGVALARGPLVEALDDAELKKQGLGGALRRAGFQQHAAVRSEPAAAEALALLHSYGGGNAAIGAWSGRV